VTKNVVAKALTYYEWPDGSQRSVPPVIFFDHFDGAELDPDKWYAPGYNRIQDDVNNEVGAMVEDAIELIGSMMRITARHVPEGILIGDSITSPTTRYYTAGQTHAKLLFRYGTIEIRAKMPGGTGLWPLAWLLGYLWYPTQPDTANTPEGVIGWPNGGWGEIDMVEFMGGSRTENNTVVHFNEHGGSYNGTLPFAADSRFMVYRLQWSADALIWSVDAEDGEGWRVLRTITDPSKIPNVLMYFIISCAIGGTGGGTPDPETFPQIYDTDWVRITPVEVG
jgi:beta-glucanase (GH16 family)